MSYRNIFSSINKYVKECEQDALLESQENIQTHKNPIYKIEEFDYNDVTRVVHIVFSETTPYRKIERYITRNYVRYPVYSEWHYKKKNIKKAVKLSNETLENLNNHEDDLLRLFCKEIIKRIDIKEMQPSWYKLHSFENAKKQELNYTSEELNNFIKKKNTEMKNDTDAISQRKSEISILNEDKGYEEKIVKNKKNKLLKLKAKKSNLLLSVISFGVASSKNRKRRIDKLNKKIREKEKSIEGLNSKINWRNSDISNLNKKINISKKSIKTKQEETDKKIHRIQSIYEKKANSIKKLCTNISEETKSFIPLKQLVGMSYQKIIGCYVIRNVEKNKYYVGQSKDVFKRITRDHFNGTNVKNIVFAEDYFTSKLEDKTNLFEVKIIPLQTKDELDRVEKELIAYYDSFINGYNGTGGNK